MGSLEYAAALSILRSVTLIVVGGILYLYIHNILSEREFRQFAKANGCQAVYESEARLPWGLDRLWRILRAEKSGKDILDDLVHGRLIRIGKHTVQNTTMFGRKVILTCEPANVQAMLATKFKDFQTGERRHNQLKPLHGKNIFTSDGPYWEHCRALLRPQFARDQINDLESTETAVQALFKALNPVAEDGWTPQLDIMQFLFRFTLDTATEFLFGESVNSQLAALSGVASHQDGSVDNANSRATAMAIDATGEDMSFAEAFTVAQEGLVVRIILGPLYWLANGKRFRKAVRVVTKFTDHFVQLALHPTWREEQKVKQLRDGNKEKYVFLDALINRTRKPDELRDQLLGRWLTLDVTPAFPMLGLPESHVPRVTVL